MNKSKPFSKDNELNSTEFESIKHKGPDPKPARKGYNQTGQLKPDQSLKPLAIGEISKKAYDKNSKSSNETDFELAFNLYLETFTEEFTPAYEFVVCIANPKSRQEFIQTFEVNAASLYSSVTLGFTPELICEKLRHFSKMNSLGNDIVEFIHKTTSSYGKCRLVLMNNKYFLESEDRKVVEYYLKLPNLTDCWNSAIYKSNPADFFDSNHSQLATRDASEFEEPSSDNAILKESNEFLMKYLDDKANEEQLRNRKVVPVYRLEVLHDKIDKVRIDREGINKYHNMLSQEFDYLSVDERTRLAINLRPDAK